MRSDSICVFHCGVEKTRPISGNLALGILVAANLLPIAGVVFRGWNAFEIVSLYWFENVVIGAVNILKIVACRPAPEDLTKDYGARQSDQMPAHLSSPAMAQKLHHGFKFILIPFFIVHYGMFCLVHGVFVATLLGENDNIMRGGPISEIKAMLSRIFESNGKWFVLAIIASHLFSYLWNFIGKGEFRRTAAHKLMIAPYGRIVVLHIAILFGAFVVTAIGSQVYLLILLIIGKIALDVKLHLRSREKLG